MKTISGVVAVMFPWRGDGAGGGRSALGTAPSGHRRNIPALRALYLLLHCLNTQSVPGGGEWGP